MPSYGEYTYGEYKLTSSMEFFFNYLKKIYESSNPIFFEKSCYIENFEDKIE